VKLFYATDVHGSDRCFTKFVNAGSFYGAMAARIDDEAARDLLRRLLRDEARHIRLHRELLAREIARLGTLGRVYMDIEAEAFDMPA